jgi:hypothetical protein
MCLDGATRDQAATRGDLDRDAASEAHRDGATSEYDISDLLRVWLDPIIRNIM